MKKLNQKKIKWIVKEGDKKDMGFYSIAQVQNITPRWAREVHKKYKGIKKMVSKRFTRFKKRNARTNFK